MNTFIRKGTCQTAEFNAPHLSMLMSEVSSFIAMLEGRGHGRYLVTHFSEGYNERNESKWFEATVFYDYFLDAWEELDLNRETELVDMADALTPEGSIE